MLPIPSPGSTTIRKLANGLVLDGYVLNVTYDLWAMLDANSGVWRGPSWPFLHNRFGRDSADMETRSVSDRQVTCRSDFWHFSTLNDNLVKK